MNRGRSTKSKVHKNEPLVRYKKKTTNASNIEPIAHVNNFLILAGDEFKKTRSKTKQRIAIPEKINKKLNIA
tara:strand:- start:2102 stop:2317 length:216 start_codon:yes stop_codon:yes gene_type:complete